MIRHYCPKFFILFYFFAQFNFNLTRTDKDCNSVSLDAIDLVFVVDGSGSVEKPNFVKMLEFIKNVTETLQVGSENTRIGFVQYSTQLQTEFPLNGHFTKEDLSNAIGKIEYMEQRTRTGKAILNTAVHSYSEENGGRSDKPRVMVVITDGESDDDVEGPSEYARNIKNIQMIAIGVTQGVEEETLDKIVGPEHLDRKLILKDFDNFKQTMDTLRLMIKRSANEMCYEQIEPPTVTEIHGLDGSEQKIMTCKRKAISESSTQESDLCYASLEGQNESAKQTYSVNVGEDVTLKCLATGETESEIRLKWFKRNENFDQSADNDEDLTKWVPLTGSLSLIDANFTLSDIKRENTGVYKCLAENAVGKTHSMNIQIDVTEQKLDCDLDEDISIQLINSTNPDSKIYCFHDNMYETYVVEKKLQFDVRWEHTRRCSQYESVQEDDQHIIDKNWLKISNAQDKNGTRYKCMFKFAGYRSIFRTVELIFLDSKLENEQQALIAEDRDCNNVHFDAMDLVFVLDGSGSVGEENFPKMLNFVTEVIEGLKIGSDETRIGLVQYGWRHRVEFHLDEYHDKESMSEAIKKISYLKEGTETGSAIAYSAFKLFSAEKGGRSDKPRVMVVITDGDSQDEVKDPSDYARNVKNIQMIAVGVTDGVKEETLDQIVGPEHLDRKLILKDFENFEQTMDTLRLKIKRSANEMCYKNIGPPTVTEIHALSDSEENIMTCKRGSALGTPNSDPCFVSMTDQDESNARKVYSVDIGQDVTLKCLATGEIDSTILVKWFKRSETFNPLVHQDDDLTKWTPLTDSLQLSDAKLYLFNAQKENSAIYKCLAENAVGKTHSMNIEIDVSEQLDIKIEAADQTVKGEQWKLECQITHGNIESPITIFKKSSEDGSLTEFSSERAKVSSNDGTGFLTLTINPVELSDEGEYVCTAERSKSDSKSLSTKLSVLEYPKISEIHDIGSEDQVLMKCKVNGAAADSSLCIVDKMGQADEDGNAYNLFQSETVSLECPATGKPAPKITWHKKSSENTWESLSPKSSLLHIVDLKTSDSSVYKCEAENSIGKAEAQIKLNVKVDCTTERRKIVKHAGESVPLNCPKVRGSENHAQKFSWIHGATKNLGTCSDLNAAKNVQTVSEDADITLTDLKPADAREYTCLVSYSKGFRQITYELDVLVLPNITEIQGVNNEDQVVMSCKVNENLAETLEGSSLCAVKILGQPEEAEPSQSQTLNAYKVFQNELVSLNCLANGNPKASVSWYKQQNDKTWKLLPNEPSSSNLVFKTIQTSDDGIYKCEAENRVGKVKAEIKLNVTVDCITDRQKITKNVGDSVSMNCPKVVGSESHATKFNWFYGATNSFDTCHDLNVENNIQSVGENADITLKNLKPEDAREYTCTVSYSRGYSKRTYELDVLSFPKISRIQDVDSEGHVVTNCTVNEDSKFCIVDKPGQTDEDENAYNLYQSEPVSLECPATGKPAPKITWHKQTSENSWESLSPNLSVQSRLHIVGLKTSDSSVYKCEAENSIGKVEAQIKLNVKVDCSTERHQIVKHAGESVTLNCPKVDNSENHAQKFSWIHGATKNLGTCSDLNAAKNQTVSEDADITLTDLKSADALEYTCTMSYGKGFRQITYELDVLVLPNITEIQDVHSENQVIMSCKVNESPVKDSEGSSLCAVKILGQPEEVELSISQTLNAYKVFRNEPVSLNCLASGNPKPSIKWYKQQNDKTWKLLPNEPSSSNLVFKTIQTSDDGIYKCEAENRVGKVKAEIKLNVTVVCDVKHEKVVKKVGQDVTLKCPTVPSSDEKLGLKYVWETEAPRSVDTCGNIDILEKIESADTDFTLKTLTPDQTRNYTCTLYYDKGSKRIISELEVLYPPAVPLAFPQHQKVHGNEKESVTLACPVKEAGGNPSPQVYWTKDGKNLTADLYNAETGDLTLENLSGLNTGRYTCFVWNSERQIHFDYDFQVYYRPVIDDNNELFIEMVRKRRSHMQHLLNGQEEAQNGIDKGQIVDETLVASQISAKLLEEDQNVGQESTLKILESSYTVLENGSVTLECFAFGIPLPNVKWMKLSEDGTKFVPFEEKTANVMSDAGSSLAFSLLKLDNVKLSHNGTYKCVAENIVGESENERQMDLIVHSPPRFPEGQKMGYFGYENETFILDCPVIGRPQPDVFWGKTSEKSLKLNEAPGYKVLENGSLEISSLATEHNADFFCYAKNLVGNSTLEINLKVGIAPKVDLKLDLPVIVKGNQFKAKCNVLKGNPAPKIRWFKDRKLISGPTERIRFENDQSLLIIDNVERKDEGSYACEAENNVNGSYSMSYEQSASLTVHELPYHPLDVQQKYIIEEHKSVLMKCPFNGNPFPSVSWFKGEVQLTENNPEIKIHKDHGATTLEILDVKESQKGSYSCKANNSVGSSTLIISLDVLVPPVLKDSQEQLKVKQGENLTVECSAVRGSPEPKVLWFKDDKVVENFNNVKVSKQGELIITNIKREDKGLYTCEAQNCVSTTKMDVNIDVLVPPTITTPKTTMTRKTLDITQKLELSCKAGGYPAPKITWFHNETEIGPSEKITADHTLIVKETSLEDSGLYTCKAVNEAGETTAKFEINIRSEPPKISIDVKGDLIIVKGQSKVVKCTASGIPEPSVSWTRNGEKISESGILRLNNVAVDESEANYQCVAQNIIAKDSKDLKIVVHEPPNIATDISKTLTMIKGQDKTIECTATGIPNPKIIWTRNNRTIANSGTLQIKNATLTETEASYMCIATNAAGSANKSTKIVVHELPQITDVPKSLTLIKGQTTVLTCKASGIPEPSISWEKNGIQVSNEKDFELKKVTFNDANSEYTCVAKNAAGKKSASVSITVHEPPQIVTKIPETLTVIKGQGTKVECTADGTPTPHVIWTRNNQTVANSGTLQIKNATLSEEASYVCVATNAAGSANKSMKIIVHELPEIVDVPKSLTLIKGQNKFLTCKASGIPEPSITWEKDGKQVSNGKDFELKNVTFNDANSEYKCVAKNSVGENSKSVSITVHETQDAEPVDIQSEQEALGCKFVTLYALDLMVVLDSSASVETHEFENIKSFASKVISHLPIGPNDVRVGLVQFESIPSGVLNLNENRETILESVLKLASDIKRLGGGTMVGSAISYTAEENFNLTKGARPQGAAGRAILLVTDGYSTYSRITEDLHGILKQKGIDLIAVSSFESNSPASYQKEFNSTIGRQYNPEHVFQFEGLGSDREVAQKIIDLSRRSMDTKCEEDFQQQIAEMRENQAYNVLPKCHVQSADSSAPRKCSRATYGNLDLAILLDDSQRTNDTMFDKMKNIIEQVAYNLRNDGRANARISLSTFNEDAKLWFDLDEYANNWDGMWRAIRAATKTHEKKARRMPVAVRTVIKQLWKESVAQKPRFMLIMTGGYVNIREARIDKFANANEVTPMVVHHRHSDPSKEQATERKYDLSYSSMEEIDNNLLKNILKDIRSTIDEACYEMIFESKDNNCEL